MAAVKAHDPRPYAVVLGMHWGFSGFVGQVPSCNQIVDFLREL